MRDPNLPTFRIWHLLLLMVLAGPFFLLLSHAPWALAMTGVMLFNGFFWYGVAKVIRLDEWGAFGILPALALGVLYFVSAFAIGIWIVSFDP